MKKIIFFTVALITVFGCKKASDSDVEYSEMITQSSNTQFESSVDGVSSVHYMEANGAKFISMEYETDNGIKSILHVKTGNTPIKAGGKTLLANKEYIVDCTGTCDCRERFIPSTGAIECTCSPCEMKIIEIESQG